MEPKIRFSRNNILYEEKTLSEISTINPKTNVPLEFEYVDLESVSGTEMTNHRTEHKATAPSRAQRLAKKGDIFYQTVRPYQRNNYYFDMDDDNYVFSTGYAQIRPSIYGKYLFTLLQNDSFLKQVLDNCAGTSFPAINPSVLSRLSVRICTDKQEQQAIASYFTSLDSQISAATSRLASLKQMKAASLQAMFPQEGETVPKIRFKGFEGEWKTCPLYHFAKKRIEKNTKMLYNITLTNSAEFGIIDQRNFFDHEISNSENINGYYVVRDHDFVYNPRISSSAPVGPINQNKLGYTGVMSPLYLVFEINGINRDFLEIFFHTTLWHKYMFDNGNTGARFDRLAISDEDFMKMPIPDIDIEEQQAIASYFTSLDRQFSLQSQRLEKLKQIKSACLDKMFV